MATVSITKMDDDAFEFVLIIFFGSHFLGLEFWIFFLSQVLV
jgi:hypothetical protein